MNGCRTMAISCDSRRSSKPQFGRTQYFFGAVVLILKNISWSVGLVSRIYDATAVRNGPRNLSSFAGSIFNNWVGFAIFQPGLQMATHYTRRRARTHAVNVRFFLLLPSWSFALVLLPHGALLLAPSRFPPVQRFAFSFARSHARLLAHSRRIAWIVLTGFKIAYMCVIFCCFSSTTAFGPRFLLPTTEKQTLVNLVGGKKKLSSCDSVPDCDVMDNRFACLLGFHDSLCTLIPPSGPMDPCVQSSTHMQCWHTAAASSFPATREPNETVFPLQCTENTVHVQNTHTHSRTHIQKHTHTREARARAATRIKREREKC